MEKKDGFEHYTDDDAEPLPRVIVKFKYEYRLPYIDNLEKYIIENKLATEEELLGQFPGISINRIYVSVLPEQVQRIEDQAFANVPLSERPQLLTFFMIDSPPGTDRYALVESLKKLNITELAYVPFSIASPPDSPNNTHAYQSFQKQLDPAPESIGAQVAWPTPNADGTGMKFIDLERGWILDHEDFLDPAGSSVFSIADPATSQLLSPADPNYDYYVAHGTSVLGTVDAPDYSGNIIGIAYKASGRVISINRVNKGEDIHDAIIKAVDPLLPNPLVEGDVLLIEAQAMDPVTYRLWPVEVNLLEYLEILTATHKNIVVIEPAGNGIDPKYGGAIGDSGNDLDSFTINGVRILNRNIPSEFRADSGAIVVGSATATIPPDRMVRTADNPESNYGSRVDCYALGEQISTTGGPYTDSYGDMFGGTSGASAMIASVALIVQGVAKACNRGNNPNRTYSPIELRKILGSFDPLTNQPWRRAAPNDIPPYGTKSNNPAIDLIGVMPDLQKIISGISCEG